jgi:hypothetical protein
MHSDRLQAFRAWLAAALAPLGSSTSWSMTVPSSALKVGVEHRVRVSGYTARYMVEIGDTVEDVADGLASDAAALAAAIEPIVVTSIGAGGLTATSSSPFGFRPEPPLSASSTPGAVPVVWANQAAPQPDAGFVSLSVGQDRPEGREYVEPAVDASMETTSMVSMRIQTIDVLLVGEWSGVSADDVRRALESPSAMADLDPMAVRNIAVLIDSAVPADTMWSPRVALSVDLAYADSRRVSGVPIEAIEAEGSVGSQNTTILAP